MTYAEDRAMVTLRHALEFGHEGPRLVRAMHIDVAEVGHEGV
jgi:hypothetical protein